MSTINKPYAWTCELRIPDGHRYFRDANTGRVAVADGSGATPDRTDDGVLWINTDLAVTIELRSGTTYGWIPVNKDGDDRVYSVSEYVVDVMRVVEAFGLTVELQGDMAKFVGEYEKYKARTATATA